MSPTPGRSILITSAPNQASSWVQVGPDCTWVKSRMRTPSSALPASPNGRLVGRGRPPPLPLAFGLGAGLDTSLAFALAFTAAGLRPASFTTLREAGRDAGRAAGLALLRTGVFFFFFAISRVL